MKLDNVLLKKDFQDASFNLRPKNVNGYTVSRDKAARAATMIALKDTFGKPLTIPEQVLKTILDGSI